MTSISINCIKDGTTFDMPLESAKYCQTIVGLIEDAGTDSQIPIANPSINGPMMEKIIAFLEFQRKEDKGTEEEQQKWLDDFFKVEIGELINVTKATNYLDCKVMFDAACMQVASKIKGKTPSEIREVFGIKQEFTEEERQAVKDENKWVEDL